jgi:hypothetical protein
MRRISPALAVGLSALGLGVLFDLLFYGKPLGINVAIFVGLLLAALVGLSKLHGTRFVYRHLWLVAPIGFFAAMLLLRDNSALVFFNILMLIGLLMLFAYFFATPSLERLSFLGYPIVLLFVLAESVAQPAPHLSKGVAFIGQTRTPIGKALPFLRGLLIALPILAVFTFLLSSADSVFSNLAEQLFSFKAFPRLDEFLWHLAIIFFIAWIAAGALYYALKSNKTSGENLPGTLVPSRALGFTECAIVLGLVNGLFLVFAYIQITFLFSGEALRSMNFEAYREYVRRGFGELCFAAVLTMVLILVMRWLGRFDTKSQLRTFNWLCTTMIGLALLLLLSAYQRMITWENVEFYINTQMRMYVKAFMLWLAVMFGWLFFTMWRNQNRFAIGLFAAIIGFMMTINVLNPDADVAGYNITRYQNTSEQELATRYLYLLSNDAVPALAEAYEKTTGYVRDKIASDLGYRLWHLEQEYNKSWREWPAFNISRWQAYEILVKMRDAGKITASPYRFG